MYWEVREGACLSARLMGVGARLAQITRQTTRLFSGLLFWLFLVLLSLGQNALAQNVTEEAEKEANTEAKTEAAKELVATGNANAGQKIYESHCRGCHAVAIGPPLEGVVGRGIASVQTFAGYSDALQARRDEVWSEQHLDAFLAAPTQAVPGTLMMMAVPDAKERADLIAFLAARTEHEQSATATSDTNALNIDRPVTIAVRRLTEAQYRNAIRDVFGDHVEVKARFEPERREEGLQAVGNASLSLTSSGFEQYFSLAQNIVEQVFGEAQESTAFSCSTNVDKNCIDDLVKTIGEQLFRRPLTAAEFEARRALVDQAEDVDAGLGLAVVSFLVAPEFLFRIEVAEPDPKRPGYARLDAYTKAARLAFLFWDAGPDDELLAAARTGELHSPEMLDAQVQRLVSSPRFEDGVRAFFSDMLQLDGFDNLIKEPAIYPKFNQAVALSAREQMLKTLVHLLVEERGDYRDLFTSNKTFINRALASVYRVPYQSDQAWAAFEFERDSGRSGILTHVGYLSLFAHPGTSSPTRRGIKLHEIFMCEPTPDPPADVDFSKVKDSAAGTVRGRLLDHMENTGCVACHRRSDPPGLALEHFDGLGQLRKYENGQLIDVSATLNGIEFEGAVGLGKLLREDNRVPACLVRNVFAYGVGRLPQGSEQVYLQNTLDRFAQEGYQLPALMRRIALAPEFYAVGQSQDVIAQVGGE